MLGGVDTDTRDARRTCRLGTHSASRTGAVRSRGAAGPHRPQSADNAPIGRDKQPGKPASLARQGKPGQARPARPAAPMRLCPAMPRGKREPHLAEAPTPPHLPRKVCKGERELAVFSAGTVRYLGAARRPSQPRPARFHQVSEGRSFFLLCHHQQPGGNPPGGERARDSLGKVKNATTVPLQLDWGRGSLGSREPGGLGCAWAGSRRRAARYLVSSPRAPSPRPSRSPPPREVTHCGGRKDRQGVPRGVAWRGAGLPVACHAMAALPEAKDVIPPWRPGSTAPDGFASSVNIAAPRLPFTGQKNSTRSRPLLLE